MFVLVIFIIRIFLLRLVLLFRQEILDFIEFDSDGNFHLVDPEIESDLLKAHSE